MHATDLLVIPCYNEEFRLPYELALSLLSDKRVEVLFVNDGSSDGTANVIKRLVQAGKGRIHLLDLPRNVGKAEAVRRGLLWAVEHKARSVGYADADFATAPKEILRLLDALYAQELSAVLGCRVARLGAHISRRLSRHVVSRIFASLASLALGVTVYDTQCGAKWFRVNAAVEATIAVPFQSRWAFDVELLGRLLGRWGSGPRLDDDDLLEIPIRAWRDVGGSKVSLRGMVRSIVDMCRMVLVAWRLGPEHAKMLEKVPMANRMPHPRTSWAPPLTELNLQELELPAQSELVALGARSVVASEGAGPTEGSGSRRVAGR